MNSRATGEFWKHYKTLSSEVKRKAREAYKLWRNNPSHPSLCFKRVKASQPVYSIRIGLAHRALGLLEGGTVTWFWIGDHKEYDRLLK